MHCPDCENGMLVVLRIDSQFKPFQNDSFLERLKIEEQLLKQMHSILTNPEKHFKKLACAKCNGTGVAYYCDSKSASFEPNSLYTDHPVLKEARASLN